MGSSLPNLDNNLTEKIHKIKCKYRYNDKICETCRIKYKDCQCCLRYTNDKGNLIEFLCCNNFYQK